MKGLRALVDTSESAVAAGPLNVTVAEGPLEDKTPLPSTPLHPCLEGAVCGLPPPLDLLTNLTI